MNINVAKLIETVRRIAGERPDTKYLAENCRYSEGACSDGTKGCLIGQALRELGIVVPFGQDTVRIGALVADEDEWLDTVQYGQDNGLTWGESIESADKKVAEG